MSNVEYITVKMQSDATPDEPQVVWNRNVIENSFQNIRPDFGPSAGKST